MGVSGIYREVKGVKWGIYLRWSMVSRRDHGEWGWTGLIPGSHGNKVSSIGKGNEWGEQGTGRRIWVNRGKTLQGWKKNDGTRIAERWLGKKND